jgi:hypothetical protein
MGRVVPGASCPWGELSLGRVVPGASCPWGELSMGRVDHGASCLWGEMSMGRDVVGRVLMGRVVQGASCLGASGPGTYLSTVQNWLKLVSLDRPWLEYEVLDIISPRPLHFNNWIILPFYIEKLNC